MSVFECKKNLRICTVLYHIITVKTKCLDSSADEREQINDKTMQSLDSTMRN